MTQGRSPMTPAEYNLIEREAVNWINKTGGKTLPGTPQSQKPPFQGFTPRVIEGGKGKDGIGTLLKDSPEAIAKIKAENKAAAERIRQRRYEEALKAEQDKMAKDPDHIPDIIDPEDFASGGIARVGYRFGSKGPGAQVQERENRRDMIRNFFFMCGFNYYFGALLPAFIFRL